MNKLTNILRGNIRQYGMIIALAAIVMLFQVTTDGVLLKPINVSNLVVQNSYILILAIGMILIIIAGHIDLSIGSVVAVTGAISAALIVPSHHGGPRHRGEPLQTDKPLRSGASRRRRTR